jgi:phage shock protein C
MEKRLFRSENDRMIAGVCGGLGAYFKIDPTLVRLLFAISLIVGFGSPGLLYLLLWIVMPNENQLSNNSQDRIREGVQEMADKTRQVVNEVRTQVKSDEPK